MMRAQTMLKLFYASVVDVHDDLHIRKDYDLARKYYTMDTYDLQSQFNTMT